MQSPWVAAATQGVSREMSRRHSRAAGLVMCARGVSEVVGAEERRMPVRECEARKQAREAPAGPVPIIRRGVVIMGELLVSGVVLPLPFVEAAAMIDGYVRFQRG
jgi:hypothetical protein